MSRSRTRRSGGEYDALDRMKHENQKLKRENARLRRIIDRVDFNEYNNIKEVVRQQTKEDRAMDIKSKRDKLQEKWRCHECGKGIMKPYLIDRRDGMRYYRSCTMCSHRTQLKPYHKGVDIELLGGEDEDADV